MNILNKLERKFGRFSIQNLMLYIVIGTGIVFGFSYLFPDIPLMQFLIFDRSAIFHGQIWRILSFVFVPEFGDPLSALFWLILYWHIGSDLENYWGTFRFNVFYFSGVIFAILSGLITGFATAHYLNLSLFLAVAILDPNRTLMLFGLLPVKIKWLAWIDVAVLIYNFIPVSVISWAIQNKLPFSFTWELMGTYNQTRIAILVSLLNFFLFFGGDFFRKIRDKFKYRKVRKNFKKNIKMTYHDGE